TKMTHLGHSLRPMLVRECRIRTDARANGTHESTIEVLDTAAARGLLATGRAAGSLTAEEMAVALHELELDTAQLEEVYHALGELQIEVVETERREELDLAVEARDFSTDTLQLFLKDVGRVELLTAAQEVELAKRIERGEH